MRAATGRSTSRARGSRLPPGAPLPLATLALALALGACAPGPRPARTPPTPVAPAPQAAVHAAYRVAAAQSEVRVLVFRDGPLAQLGHNHVLVSHALSGAVDVAGAPPDLRFELALPVVEFAIDEPAARREEGDAFASEPSAADVAATRRNLLGPAVLDAEHYPLLRVAGLGAMRERAAGPDAGRYRVRLRIELRGRASELEVPVTVTIAGEELEAAGEFRVAQSALGLTPFSVALGTLRVAEELVVRVRIHARREP